MSVSLLIYKRKYKSLLGGVDSLRFLAIKCVDAALLSSFLGADILLGNLELRTIGT